MKQNQILKQVCGLLALCAVSAAALCGLLWMLLHSFAADAAPQAAVPAAAGSLPAAAQSAALEAPAAVSLQNYPKPAAGEPWGTLTLQETGEQWVIFADASDENGAVLAQEGPLPGAAGTVQLTLTHARGAADFEPGFTLLANLPWGSYAYLLLGEDATEGALALCGTAESGEAWTRFAVPANAHTPALEDVP